MTTSKLDVVDLAHLAVSQRRRLKRFACTQSVDIHAHCLPCLDDGPGALSDSIELCRALVSDGITTVIATPHQLGRYHQRNEAAEVRQAVESLNRSLMVEGIPLRVMPGGDVRIDERLIRLLSEERILPLAGSNYLLLELPSDTFIDAAPLLQQLSRERLRPILSHPERNHFLVERPVLIEPWLSSGAVLQLTAGSFLGDFGAMAQRAAWFWLETGQASLVASDSHDILHRPPRMTQAIEAIAQRLGESIARRVCIENPLRIVRDQALEQTAPQADFLDDLAL